jgi:uncharacterized SAM-binding protein YcdF (DUF218 family)
MRRHLSRAWIWIRTLLVSFAIVFWIVTLTPVTRWWARALATPWYGSEGDVLVVLGGSDQGDALGESSYIRAIYAVRAYREAHYRQIILSGDTVGERMKEFLIGHGVPADRLVVEERSKSTYENVKFVAPLLDRHSRIVLLTSDYHVYRSLRLFRKAGIEVRPFPAPDALKRYGFALKRWSAAQDLSLETIKIGFYKARGWL